MVCMVQIGRMAAMVRLLKPDSLLEIAPELAAHEKIAALTLHRELHEADEANLLEEEDMHVFDSRPLTDPLHLVCCNACKKPVKASQYAAHAERCRSLNSSEIGLELSGGSGQKKPPTKGKKISQATNGNQGICIEDQEKSESTDGNDAGRSESNFDNLSGMISTLSREAQICFKDTTKSADHAAEIGASETGPGSTNCFTGGEFQKKLVARREVPCIAQTKYHKDAKMHENDIDRNENLCNVSEAPVPLATKMYYAQGSHHLRLQLGYLYCKGSTKELGIASTCSEPLRDNMICSKPSTSNSSFHGAPRDDVSQNSDQFLRQSSDHFGASGELTSVVTYPDQFRDNSLLKPDLPAASLRVTKTRNVSTPYYCPGSSG